MVRRSPGEAGPFLKWAGGKSQLLDDLVAQVPERFGAYHEPFVGGGALFFRLKSLGRLREAHLSDINHELIIAYQAMRDCVDEVIAELEKIEAKTSEEDYYAIRALDPDTMGPAQRTARLIYLNRIGFNGLYRVNSEGKFNVPYGRYAKPNVLDRERLLLAGRALQGVTIEQAPYTTVLERSRKGDFVYFDPPYQPMSKTSSFTAYAREGFGEEEQRQLARLFGELAQRGVSVLLSNSETSLTTSLYEGRGFEVTRIDARRAINCKVAGRGAVKELLVRSPARVPKEVARRTSAVQLSIAFPEPAAVASPHSVRLTGDSEEGARAREHAPHPGQGAKHEAEAS